jgi:hypothetical protein
MFAVVAVAFDNSS